MSTIAASVVDLPEPVGPVTTHEAALESREVHDDGREPELVHVLDLERDHPEDGAHGVALQEHVHAEAGPSRERVRHVQLELLLEPLPQLLRQDRVDHALQRSRRERRVVARRLELTVDPHHRRGARREVQVGASLLQEGAEQLGNGDLDVFFLLDH